ncbi:DUF1259 domain-containing protein [Streptomyces sp. NPDC058964]|uniref:DUF1259 domain-containing protein n=1 Tax=Streptomyces sp. NPDC058964 TaxID=3346681 RepID=UPI0036BE13AA
MADDRQQHIPPSPTTSRRRMLATAALAPVLTVANAAAGPIPPARAATAAAASEPLPVPVQPVLTALADWSDVGAALGAPGDMKRYMYHTGLPRQDLDVHTRGIRVNPALALGTHVSFVRYADGSTLLMGDVVVTECELQPFSDALHEHGILQTAIHKHLLAQRPDIWWCHVHAHGTDPVTVARGLRAALDRTATPFPTTATTSSSTVPVDLDTAAIDATIGVKGGVDSGVYKSTFIRRETITDGHLVLPPGLGSTTSINYQPLGRGRAAINGDFVMIAGEVQDVLAGLRRAGAELVEVHHHNLTDEPRLFFVHYWAVGDALALTRGLRPVVDATNVVPMPGAGA